MTRRGHVGSHSNRRVLMLARAVCLAEDDEQRNVVFEQVMQAIRKEGQHSGTVIAKLVEYLFGSDGQEGQGRHYGLDRDTFYERLDDVSQPRELLLPTSTNQSFVYGFREVDHKRLMNVLSGMLEHNVANNEANTKAFVDWIMAQPWARYTFDTQSWKQGELKDVGTTKTSDVGVVVDLLTRGHIARQRLNDLLHDMLDHASVDEKKLAYELRRLYNESDSSRKKSHLREVLDDRLAVLERASKGRFSAERILRAVTDDEPGDEVKKTDAKKHEHAQPAQTSVTTAPGVREKKKKTVETPKQQPASEEKRQEQKEEKPGKEEGPAEKTEEKERSEKDVSADVFTLFHGKRRPDDVYDELARDTKKARVQLMKSGPLRGNREKVDDELQKRAQRWLDERVKEGELAEGDVGELMNRLSEQLRKDEL